FRLAGQWRSGQSIREVGSGCDEGFLLRAGEDLLGDRLGGGVPILTAQTSDAESLRLETLLEAARNDTCAADEGDLLHALLLQQRQQLSIGLSASNRDNGRALFDRGRGSCEGIRIVG